MKRTVRRRISFLCAVIVLISLVTESLHLAGARLAAADNVINISSVEDLLAAKEYLEKNTSYAILNQTCDIKVSPYSYKYYEENHRIAICYDGVAEAYYDVDDAQYYSDLTTTGSAISYQWKVSSWVPIGGRCEYRGNHYTIEGLYQKKASTNSSTATGLFSGSCVLVK